MQAAEQLIREGRVSDALDTLKDAIRKNPADAKLRVFLFQLLCVQGDWDRAMNQLTVAKDLDAGAVLMSQVCGQAIRCERFRQAVFAGERTPLIFGEPPAWIGLLVQANQLTGQGHLDQAAELRDRAFEEAPAIGGSINGEPFEWLADVDVRLGPVFEALIEGKYYWVPMSAVTKLEVDEPSDLRDVVWAPGTFTFTNGGTAIALLPVRYPGSEASEDDAVRLARKTEFLEPARHTCLGLGQRMWATDAGEYAMLSTRELVLDSPAGADASPGSHADG